MNLDTVLLRPLVLAHSQQHCPVARLLVSTFHPARSQPCSWEEHGNVQQEGEWRAEQAQELSPPAPTLLQLFKPSSGSAEALQSQPRVLSSHTSQREGLALRCCCVTAALAVLWPPLLLGHWQYCHSFWPHEKAAFWQCKSSILNDTRLIVQPPSPYSGKGLYLPSGI